MLSIPVNFFDRLGEVPTNQTQGNRWTNSGEIAVVPCSREQADGNTKTMGTYILKAPKYQNATLLPLS
jgi:hypothetical protein